MTRHAPRATARTGTFAGSLAAVAVGLAVASTLLAAPAGAGVTTTGRARSADPALVRTTEGLLRGAVHPGGRLFAGIPYAAAPVGDRRFRPPAPAQPWTGERPATWPGPACAQNPPSYGTVGSTAEDCLTLNVHTPPLGTATGRATSVPRPKPVMVWIHGGAFTSGSGGAYNGGVLATRGDVVVVTINYRLGAFGFLVHPALDAEATAAAGNYGLQDQQAALRWVQRNIRAFGGDPRNVTIFGESAGGASVCSHLASPTARGLFHRAIAQSGCSSLGSTRAAAAARGSAWAAEAGCPDPATAAACLRALPVQRVLATGPTGLADLAWAPVPGDAVLPRPVPEAFRTGAFHRVPFVNGTNTDEGTFLLRVVLGNLLLDEATYRFALSTRYGDRWPEVLAEYPTQEYPTPSNAFAATITDAAFACPAAEVARTAARRTPMWGYEFADRQAPQLIPAGFPQGAYHAAEIQYVFQRTPVLSLVPAFTPAQQALSDTMLRYWTTFARTGSPNGYRHAAHGADPTPRWPALTTARLQSLDPGGIRPITLSSYAEAHHCDFWQRSRASS